MTFPRWLSKTVLLVAAVTGGTAALAFLPATRWWLGSALGGIKGQQVPDSTTTHRPSPVQVTGVAPVPDRPDTLAVPDAVVRSLGIRTAPASRPSRLQRLEMIGTLAIDTDRMAHVHTRFAGEVVELGTIEDASPGTNGGPPTRRPIRYGDRIGKGQLLAVLWSSELGEKKSAYVDALSRLQLERETLSRLEALYRDQAVTERNLRETRRTVEAAEIVAASAERTLRVLRLSEEEIAAIRAEAESLRGGKAARDRRVERDWARVELRSPLEGTILEKNLAAGDIVDTSLDLYKIADLDQLTIWAHAYEDDLPRLQTLPAPIPWTVRLKSEPAGVLLAGAIERIGDIIDPTQHTALVMGQVANPDRRLKVGQFVVATVDLPPPPNVVEIPIDALVEDGHESIVFVQPDPLVHEYAQHRVEVVRQFDDCAYVHGLPISPGAPGQLGSPHTGDQVVVSGSVELRASLGRLHSAKRSEAAK
ncbi:efflux RND transporter periplasmic adaptor subunit [Singulisphaera acidiphila]|uniref:Membrane-fusion protein n=1 Tax=Singulisphaera acidiphila (strain ATCC BAA-1392 / DSM 18658 / VKM B-2454 / MOB10) TaxID=886293 RepID=L0DN76_SINAD|nr:efflux RND transporter periplasmic adaptor subunit [Singulisphaera acidiphila]AGA30829.1 membrane-fusion protein [Singulisphaera acidiphila DSM 18658]